MSAVGSPACLKNPFFFVTQNDGLPCMRAALHETSILHSIAYRLYRFGCSDSCTAMEVSLSSALACCALAALGYVAYCVVFQSLLNRWRFRHIPGTARGQRGFGLPLPTRRALERKRKFPSLRPSRSLPPGSSGSAETMLWLQHVYVDFARVSLTASHTIRNSPPPNQSGHSIGVPGWLAAPWSSLQPKLNSCWVPMQGQSQGFLSAPWTFPVARQWRISTWSSPRPTEASAWLG